VPSSGYKGTATEPFDSGAPTLGVDARVGERAGDGAIRLLRSAMGGSLFSLQLARYVGAREGGASRERGRGGWPHGLLCRWRRLSPAPAGAPDAGKKTPPPPSGV
jgi:hypothetical protein